MRRSLALVSLTGAAIAAALTGAASPARAQRFGYFGGYYPPPPYYVVPPPVIYEPPPVYYAPPPVAYTPRPVRHTRPRSAVRAASVQCVRMPAPIPAPPAPSTQATPAPHHDVYPPEAP